MRPEISHRCPSCGASVRDFGERAMFCPECGKTLTERDSETSYQENSPAAAERAADAAEPAVVPTKEVANAEGAVVAPEEVETAKATVTESAANTDTDKPVVVLPEELTTAKAPVTERDPAKETIGDDRHKARERTRETLHRASTRARGAIEDNVKRVEKIHHVSTVMWEEATYDPSLRFVLVALGLFVVFVILLILSKVMG